VKQESTGSTLWNKSQQVVHCETRLVLPVDFCFTVYYPLTLVSQYTTCWLLFHSVLPVDSCYKSQQVVRCETRVNRWYTVKQDSTGSTMWNKSHYPLTLVSQCTTCWLLFHSVLPVDSCFTVYYLLTLVSQCTTRWLLFHSVLQSQQLVHCETRVNG
jgi:hypothetical protein